MDEFADFQWASEAELASRAAGPLPWGHYLNTKVEFDGHGTLHPVADGAGGDQPPLESLHVITAVQPDGVPDSPDSRARLAVLDRHLSAADIRFIRAAGVAVDGTHREESRAVFGLDDAAARALGLRFGQVAVFGWDGPSWSLLACATDRQEHRGWRWQPR